MIEPQSKLETDVLKEKARQIKGLLENCIAMLSISPVFTKTSTRIGKAWSLCHFLVTCDDEKALNKRFKSVAKEIDKALGELYETESTLKQHIFYPVFYDAEKALCEAWETTLANVPSRDEKPQFSPEGYMSVLWELARYKYMSEGGQS